MALIALLIPVSGSVGTTLSDAALRERICLSGLRGRKNRRRGQRFKVKSGQKKPLSFRERLGFPTRWPETEAKIF